MTHVDTFIVYFIRCLKDFDSFLKNVKTIICGHYLAGNVTASYSLHETLTSNSVKLFSNFHTEGRDKQESTA